MSTNLSLIYTVSAVLLSAGLLLLGRVVWSLTAGYDAEHQLTEADNPAVGTSLFGFLGGLVIVLVALLATEGSPVDDPIGLAWDLGEMVIYGVLAIGLMRLSGVVNDKAILYKFSNKKEIVDDRNVGTGAVLGGSYLASGLIIAGALGGRVDPELIAEQATRLDIIAHEIGIALAFYAVGQVALVIFGVLYQLMQPRDVHEAIAADYVKDGVKHGGNAAAGMAFGGNLLALGLVMWGGARHDFSSWGDSFVTLGIATGVGLALLPLWRIVVDKVMLARADLGKEIYEDRNVNAALLEVSTVLGLAAVLALLL
ncbi:MAG: DUF350 domain-containing protein [Myxococcales bacterium]|nr:DUF350 domain-containing protein [Myxococcales bacterium]MCB9521939.1 DUF350 domain-containing protein [Myxococcales bacterium]